MSRAHEVRTGPVAGAGAGAGAGDDRGSMLLAMLLILVGLMLSALLVPIAMGQITATRAQDRRQDDLTAAQAGLDVGLAHIRAASDGVLDATGHKTGTLAELPCGPITGTVGGGTVLRYQVTIDYFGQDPHGASDTWIAANRMSCVNGGGTFSAPAYALLRAQGTDTATGAFGSVQARSMQATYTFQTTNSNIPGGLVHTYPVAGSLDLCLDGGSTSPVAGTNVTMQLCVPSSLQQRFAYTSNLNLVLTASKTATLPLGMCLDAAKPHGNGGVIQFQPCAATTTPGQQWSYNDSANFEGTTDGVSLDKYCFNAQTPNTAGSFIVLRTGSPYCRSGGTTTNSFSPEPAVGAGAAGDSSGQLVNFLEFGRCADITEFNVNYGYTIVWPCKQAPDPTYVGWNQKWALPPVVSPATSATGPITVNNGTTKYCLKSPRTTAPGVYPVFVACPTGTVPPELTWTRSQGTGDYASSYRIEDIDGNCLAPTDPSGTDLYPNGLHISKIVVVGCSGSTLLKWNAPANIAQTVPVKDIGEK